MPAVTITYDGRQVFSGSMTVPVAVTYDGRNIVSIPSSTTKTLICNGKVMKDNVVVGAKTMNCSGKIAKSNIVISVGSSGTTAAVSCSGSGNSSYCYATISGTKRTGSWSGTVNHGASITFGIWGGKNVSGTLTIDGTQVASKNNGSATYAWTVPACDSVTIQFSYNSNKNNGYGNIVVTTG